MQATEILSSEHRIIERVIAALETAAGRLDAGMPVRPGFFIDCARFIREFADGYHHAKEEDVLFAVMARNGMSTDAGPIGVMLYEHERGRELTRGLRQAAERLLAGDRDADAAVVDHARAYAELLTQHIHKEDVILFPMAAQIIVPGQQDEVLEAFARVEAERAEMATKASLLALADALGAEMRAVRQVSPVS